jgi:hypothetical protein
VGLTNPNGTEVPSLVRELVQPAPSLLRGGLSLYIWANLYRMARLCWEAGQSLMPATGAVGSTSAAHEALLSAYTRCFHEVTSQTLRMISPGPPDSNG